MRDFRTAFLACVVSLSLVVLGDPLSSSPWSIPSELLSFEGGKSAAESWFSVLATRTSAVTASIVSSSPSLSSSLPSSSQQPSTTATTIDVSTFISANSSSPSTARASTTDSSLQVSTIPMSSSSSTPSGDDSSSHRTLIIVLATVLSFVGLTLIGAIIFLIYRYRKGQTPFGHRGASPINDDEIASWRRTAQEQKFTLPPATHRPAIREVSAIPLSNSPGWSWTASPSSIRTVSAHIGDPHSVLAQAPNARAGLTDEVVPGADPFITPPKRQNSRLSKLPPGHARSKSRRSSMSGKSLWGGNERTSSDLKAQEASSTWYAQDDVTISSHFRGTEHGSSSPGTSIFDGLSTGGLSPRPAPRTRPWEHQVSSEDIGRAIA